METTALKQPSDGWRTMRRSTSQRRTFRQCGYKFLHQYANGWKQQTRRGTYAFGDTAQGVADAILLRMVRSPEAASELFLQRWAEFEHGTDERGQTLTWTKRASWGFLRDRGAALMAYMARELPTIMGKPNVEHLNEQITYSCGGVEELAIPDFYGWARSGADPDGEYVPSVIDFKTSDRMYDVLAAEIDEQLTDYQMAEQSLGRPVRQVGLCVLIYGAEPRIQWLMAPARPASEITLFTTTAQAVDAQIRAGVFIRDDRACHNMGACAFIPLCYPSQRDRVATELRQTQQIEAVSTDLDEEI